VSDFISSNTQGDFQHFQTADLLAKCRIETRAALFDISEVERCSVSNDLNVTGVPEIGSPTILPGPASINYALSHPTGVDSVIMLNSAYAEDSTVLWPEMITLFATKSLHALAIAIAQSPEQFGWLLTWQQQKFRDALPDAQKPHFDIFLGPLIRENFVAQPSSGPAFVQMAAQFFDALAQNAKRLAELKALDVPVKLI
jgi:hypothetical protein